MNNLKKSIINCIRELELIKMEIALNDTYGCHSKENSIDRIDVLSGRLYSFMIDSDNDDFFIEEKPL